MAEAYSAFYMCVDHLLPVIHASPDALPNSHQKSTSLLLWRSENRV